MRYSLTALTLALFVAGAALAQSQEPSPAPANTEQKKQAHPKHEQQRASTDQRGTESSPLFIKVVPSLPVEPRSSEHTEKPNDYASPEWGLVWVTIILAAITAILACYTAKLWGATKALAEDAKETAARQAEDMQASLKIANISAKSTTDAAKAAQDSADTAEASVKLAREEFITTHRPRLVVRRIGPHKRIGPPIALEYTVHNIGDSEARVIAISEKICLADTTYPDKLPIIPPYSDSMPKSIHLAPSQSVTLEYKAPMALHEQLCFAYGFEVDNRHPHVPSAIFFLGYIDYVDKVGMKRQTAFLRKLDFDTKRFDAINHPDYEYQD